MCVSSSIHQALSSSLTWIYAALILGPVWMITGLVFITLVFAQGDNTFATKNISPEFDCVQMAILPAEAN